MKYNLISQSVSRFAVGAILVWVWAIHELPRQRQHELPRQKKYIKQKTINNKNEIQSPNT